MSRSPYIDAVKEAIERDPESWMAPHRDAMAFFDYRDRFQEWISEQSAVFSFIMSRIRSWERSILEGNLDFSEEDEKSFLAVFRMWLAHCSKSLADLRRLTGEAPVSGSDEFFDQIRQAKDYIARIERIAAQERSHGMRGVRLDEAEAETFRRIVADSPTGTPPKS